LLKEDGKKMRVAKTFVPPEAHAIADQFRRAANQLRTSSENLNQISGVLDNGWLGHSKELFFDLYRNQPTAVNAMADWLTDRANYVENIHVTIWEEI
jgi:uncharacterized protein YukE